SGSFSGPQPICALNLYLRKFTNQTTVVRGLSQMRLCFLLVLGWSSLLAQEGQPAEASLGADSLAAASAPSDLYTPPTLSQQYLWSLHQVFDPTRLFFVAAHAAIDHSRDDPAGWGQGGTGYT